LVRKAKVKDGEKIFKILQEFAISGLLLPRSLNSIYENIRDFFVYENNGDIVAVCSLHIYWEDLAEIKSLAVLNQFQKKGIGKELVKECLKDAENLGIKKVFALTYVPEFFERLNFKIVDKSNFPQKIWNECIHCSKFTDCKEIPVLYRFEGEDK